MYSNASPQTPYYNTPPVPLMFSSKLPKSYEGHRFEKMCTPNYQTDSSYHFLIKGNIGNFKILTTAEIDAVSEANNEAIELKCRLRVRDKKRGTSSSDIAHIKEKSVSLNFAQGSSKKTGMVGILFVITVDPTISSTPFADIQAASYFQTEAEILFSMHSIFRINQVKRIDEGGQLFEVQLALTADDDEQLRRLTRRFEEETQGITGWSRIAKLLIRVGQLDKAEELCLTLLGQTLEQHDQAYYHNDLGRIKDQQGDYEAAIRYYEQSIGIMESNLQKLCWEQFYYSANDMTWPSQCKLAHLVIKFFVTLGIPSNDMIDLPSLIAPFEVPFWLDDKCWFTVCEWVLGHAQNWRPYGARYLALALRENLTLETSVIYDYGAQKLASGLRDNTILKTVIFSHNRIGATGTKSLADVIQDNTTLTTFILKNTRIGIKRRKYLANMLKINKTLVEIDLTNN
ncbi:hypothetical protein I4U23_005217 [Adineta vaga]|nr:hypothetical protein I4U23_005217 [Adineta vaga]